MWNKGHTWNFINQREMHNFIESPICMGRERTKNPVHPTQKPVKVLKHIIRIASNPGDLVFDPFMGVGSTGVAATVLRRRFLGIEIDKGYFAAAQKRLKTVQPDLLEQARPEREVAIPVAG
jgi:site-specific DNA-methyltransferase (adenine-specific)/modification methylase